MERHVALVTQQLHVSVLLAATHAAGAEATLCVRVSLAVLTLRPALPWIQTDMYRHVEMSSRYGCFTNTLLYCVCVPPYV